jgi:hypothetical protein
MARNKTYASGEPKDWGLIPIALGLMLLSTLFIISFIAYGHGSALLGMILLITRLLAVVVIVGGTILAVIAFWKKASRDAALLLVAALIAVIAIILLSPL